MLFSHQRGPFDFVFISDICHLTVTNAKTVISYSYSMTNPNRNVLMVDWISSSLGITQKESCMRFYTNHVFDFIDIIHTGFWGQSLVKAR